MKRRLILFFLLAGSLFMYGQSSIEPFPSCFHQGSLSIRTNVAPWLMLTPNIGVEYKVSDGVGILVDGGWAHWKLNTRNKYWRVWNVAPQVRYYAGSQADNYIGIQYTMGEYNLTGNQGRYMGGGFTLGHQFYCSRRLMVDLGLSLGYLYLHDKEEYERIDGYNYRTKVKSSHGYWGPTGLSISFVWKIN